MQEKINRELIDKEIEKIKLEQNRKRKWKFISICFLIIIATITSLGFIYQKLNRNPVYIYKTVINTGYKYLSKNMQNIPINKFVPKVEEKPLVLSLTGSIDTNKKELQSLKKDYGIALGLDYNKELATLDFNIKDKKETILNVLGLLDKEKLYLKSPEILNQVFFLGEYDFFNNLKMEENLKNNLIYNTEDLDYLIQTIKDAYLGSIDKTKLKLTNSKIEIEGKKYNSKKLTYLLDKENMERTIKYILDNLLEDEKALEILANLTNSSPRIVEKNLQEHFDNLDLTDFEYLKMEIYLDKSNNFLALALKDPENELVKLTSASGITTLIIKDDYNTLEFKMEGENKFLKVIQEDKEILNLKCKTYKDSLIIDYNYYEGVNFTGTITIENIVVKEQELTFNYDVNMESASNTDLVNIKGNFTLEQKELKPLSTKGNTKFENLSEKEITEMYVSLMNIIDDIGIKDILDFKNI